jgi:hypothetical protein
MMSPFPNDSDEGSADWYGYKACTLHSTRGIDMLRVRLMWNVEEEGRKEKKPSMCSPVSRPVRKFVRVGLRRV